MCAYVHTYPQSSSFRGCLETPEFDPAPYYETMSYVAQVGIKFPVKPGMALNPPECWGYRHVPPCLLYRTLELKLGASHMLGLQPSHTLSLPELGFYNKASETPLEAFGQEAWRGERPRQR